MMSDQTGVFPAWIFLRGGFLAMNHMETDRAANGEQEALGKIQDLASQAAETMRGILENPKASIYTQIQVIGKVLERT